MVIEMHHAIIEFAIATSVVGFLLSFPPDPKARAGGRTVAFAGLFMALLARLFFSGDSQFGWEIPAAGLFFILAVGFGIYYLHLSVSSFPEKTPLQS